MIVSNVNQLRNDSALTSPQVEHLRNNGDRFQSFPRTPSDEESSHIWGHLDTSASLSEFRGSLENSDIVSSASEKESRGEPSNTCTDN